jgi:hypothetical protein
MVLYALAALPIKRLKALGRVNPEAAYNTLNIILLRSSSIN